MKYLKFLILVLTLTSVYATSLNIEIPKEVKVGDEFNITLNVKNDQSIVGFECSVNVPHNLKITSFSGNQDIKKMAGKFYEEKMTNNSCIVKFVVFDNPLKSDFYVGRVTVKVLDYDNSTRIKIVSKGSDENGNKIDIFSGDVELKVKKENETSEKKGFLDMIAGFISSIIDVIKRLFG
ncbi:hypothetical protein [Methanotorris formicicus]|uniref:Cellulosome anchoring protein cohesin region n=1 Tax=Methanotorris formicicus Mc-S-70 TaxID=647171 RepID=H1L0G8_9EURY|nr:hypothetical protein [Methanotorris formicicus]EHP84863.1 cellulosome anchoring protein cohesin region [Methanotorris formicicus Mc-S-70]